MFSLKFFKTGLIFVYTVPVCQTHYHNLRQIGLKISKPKKFGPQHLDIGANGQLSCLLWVNHNGVIYFSLCRGTLDLNLKHAAIEKKSSHDIHARKMREKERDLKYVIKVVLFCPQQMTSISDIQCTHACSCSAQL